MTAWATISDVDTFTGQTVTDAEIARAQAIIEIFANTTEEATDATPVSGRNAKLLAQAVSYQAAWMSEHPDVFTNVDVSSFSQDGMSASHAHTEAALVAPLAMRCIRRLSWNLQPLQAWKRSSVYTDTGNRNSAVRDDQMPWIPLP